MWILICIKRNDFLWSLMMGLKFKEHLVLVWGWSRIMLWLMYIGYLYFFFFNLCKGKTTSNKFCITNLNLLQVFMSRINNFSTLGHNTCKFKVIVFYPRTTVACQFVCLCVSRHFKTELKDVNLKLVLYLICPRFSK